MEPTDEELMRAYVNGDASAFDALFARYSGRVHQLIRRQVRSEADCRDLVQQTFLHLHRARADFREGMKLRPWLFTIALNVRRELFRKRGRRPEAPLELDGRQDPQAAPYDATREEDARQLRVALAALPENQREVIELHWFAGLPFQEVAKVVGATESAVKVRAHRGYARLREAIEALADDSAQPQGPPGHRAKERG